MAITTTISNFPAAPDSSTDTPTEFNTKADAFVNHQAGVYTGEVNQWATEANGLKGEMNTIKTEIDGIVSTIPAGTINDTVIATDKVWSSSKIKTDLVTDKVTIIDKILNYVGDRLHSNGKEVALTEDNGGVTSGNNANGEWTKFPDRTMICTSTGKVLESTDAWTFPAAFIAVPRVTLTVVAVGGNARMSTHGASSTTSVTVYAYDKDGASSSGSIDAIAIGKWK